MAELKPDFDTGVPTLEDTLNAIKAAAAREPSWSKDSSNGTGGSETAADPQETAPSVPELPETTQEASPEAVSPETGAQASTAGVPQETVSPKLRRLLEKEAALIEREKALAAREKAAAPGATQNAPAANLSVAQLQALYRRDPVAALKALDDQFQPGRLAKKLWYHDLGDLAPKDARAELQADTAVSAVEALRLEMEERQQEILRTIQEQQNQLAYQQYVGALEAYTAKLPDSLPLVKKFTAKKPQKVVQALVGVAQKHAQATNGREVLSPEQAAAKLEASLRELQLNESPVQTSAPANAPATQPAAAPVVPGTLRNKHTVVQPNREVDDSLDDTKLRERAFKAIEAAKRSAHQQ